MTSKWKQLKDAIANPPPERLAAIEYRSAFLQIMGIIFVCIILIAKGFWWVIFALIFGVGISYSQGITAYQKYQMMMELKSPETIGDIDREISPSRKRGRIVRHVFGEKPRYASSVIAVVAAAFTIPPSLNIWYYNLAFVLLIATYYIGVYFFVFYWIANYIYRRERRLK